LALIALTFARAAGAQSTCTESDSTAATAIRQRLIQWVDASNRGDAAAAREIWAPDRLRDLVGWFPRAAVVADSTAYAVAGLQYQPGAGPGEVRFAMTVEDVTVNGPIARTRDTWLETRRLPGARGIVQRAIRGGELWRCQPDGWWRIARRYEGAPGPWEYVQ
jgi:ketosteroid isomerase-like protein